MTTFTNESFYFGCWDRPGHYLFSVTGRTLHERAAGLPADFPVKIHVLDGGLLGYPDAEREGEVVLSHIGGWTILSFWDRSLDQRGACNSSFIMRGRLQFADAVAVARDKFPSIFARFKFEIRPKE